MLGSTADYCLHLTHGGIGLNLDRIHTIFLGEKFDLALWSIINNCLWGALSQRLGRERLEASFASRFCSISLLVNKSPHSQTNKSCTLSVSTMVLYKTCDCVDLHFYVACKNVGSIWSSTWTSSAVNQLYKLVIIMLLLRFEIGRII